MSDINDWANVIYRQRQEATQKAIVEWQGLIIPERDLVCRACYQQGPWGFRYAPMYVHIQKTRNPVLAVCLCGAGLTIEEALALRSVRQELDACW